MENFIKPGIPYPAWNDHNVESPGIVIHSESNIPVGGYQIPDLDANQVTESYNAVVSAKVCVISDVTGKYHFIVNQADALNGEISIEILYFNYMLITYTTDGDSVEVSHYDMRQS